MIVKNESKIIERMLNSVLPIVTHYCICDTGSDDDTIHIISNFFSKNNISGKIIKEPFKNFGYNRNVALEASYGLSEYILFMDADMTLSIKDRNKFYMLLNSNESLKNRAISYTLSQGSNDFHYQNIRIIRSPIRNIALQEKLSLYKYIGPTHEYLSTPERCLSFHIDKDIAFINDLGDGGSKQNKFKRDIELLTNNLELNHNDPRSLFYLANSYADYGDSDNAIKTYHRRIKAGGWYQEIWYSYYKIGNIYEEQKKYDKAIYNWFQAYSIMPERLENIYKIIKYYRETSTNYQKIAFKLYSSFVPKYPCKVNRDHFLFLENDVYSYKLYYEYIILAYYNGIKDVSNELVHILNNATNITIANSVMNNYKFYVKSLFCEKKIELNETFYWNNWELTSSSACIIKLPTRDFNKKMGASYLMNQRFVNYKINPDGTYPYYNTIATVNKCIYLNDNLKNLSSFVFQDNSNKNDKYYGIEDVRIYFSSDYFSPKERLREKERLNDEKKGKNEKLCEKTLVFNGTHYTKNKKIGVCYGKYDIFSNEKELIHNELTCIQHPNSECEKNWVFVDISNETHMIYKWFPLEIGKIINNDNCSKLDICITKKMPSFFQNVRGSTNACKVFLNNKNGKKTTEYEWWFICHIVSYESPRHYYHIIVKFDKDMNLKKYSAPFKFNDENNEIEYCLGIIVEDRRILISYSNWDRTTTLGIYDRKYINEQMIYS